MAEVKWIKITTDIFDDEKILLIESMPERDSLIVIWFKLLCMAGKQNNSGVFMLNDKIAYTEEMLATIFRRPLNTVRLALQVFEQFGMVEIIDGVVTIPNWGKHQNLDQLEKKQEYMRNYMKGYREKQKQLTENINSKTSCKTNSKSNVRQADIDIDKEEDIEIEEEKDIYIKAEVSGEAAEPPGEKPKKKKQTKEKPAKHKYGEYGNVLLTDDEHGKLLNKYGEVDTKDAIAYLDVYIAEKGYKTKSHYLTICRWVMDAVQDKKAKGNFNTIQKGKSGRLDWIDEVVF